MQFRPKMLAATACATALATVFCLPGRASDAPPLPLSVQTQLAPELDGTAEDRYTFYGEAGTAVIVTLVSEDFDPVLLLSGPDGELLVLNDDTDGTDTTATPVVETGTQNWLDSAMYLPLPQTGTYTLQARSFSGLGGDYDLMVRPATPYEVVLYQGRRAYNEYYNNPDSRQNHQTALALFQAAIAIDPDQPYAYLDSAFARLSLALINRPDDIDPSVPVYEYDRQLRDALIDDFSAVLQTLDAQGMTDVAMYDYASDFLGRLQTAE
ncbi:MAG: hypothetical protein AAFU71_13670 [Cyanobacteria bacterium J06632_22]